MAGRRPKGHHRRPLATPAPIIRPTPASPHAAAHAAGKGPIRRLGDHDRKQKGENTSAPAGSAPGPAGTSQRRNEQKRHSHQDRRCQAEQEQQVRPYASVTVRLHGDPLWRPAQTVCPGSPGSEHAILPFRPARVDLPQREAHGRTPGTPAPSHSTAHSRTAGTAAPLAGRASDPGTASGRSAGQHTRQGSPSATRSATPARARSQAGFCRSQHQPMRRASKCMHIPATNSNYGLSE